MIMRAVYLLASPIYGGMPLTLNTFNIDQRIRQENQIADMLGQLINLQRRIYQNIQQSQKNMTENTNCLQKAIDDGFEILNRRFSTL